MGRRIVLLVLLIAGLAAACFVAGHRARVECRNRAVEFVLDYDEVARVAAASGVDVSTALKRFKKAGATTVAISEQTFGDAVEARLISPYSNKHFAVDNSVSTRIIANLSMALPNISGSIISTTIAPAEDGSTPGFTVLTISKPLPLSYLRELPVGLPEDALANAQIAGLKIIARLVNYTGASPEATNSRMKYLHDAGIEKVIFTGDQVLGYRGSVEETAQALIKNKLYYGRVEFSKQKGEVELATKAASNVIPVHSITSSEMPQLSLPTILERFRKAARERGIKICYVRLFYNASDNLLDSNADYVNKVAASIDSGGYEVKNSRPIPELEVPSYIRIIAAVGVAAGAVFLLIAVFDLSMAALVIWTAALTLGCAGLAFAGETGRKAVALLSALVFPTMAALNATRFAPESETQPDHFLIRVIGRFAGAVITVAMGGLLIVGLLSERAFMLRIDQFAGVKLAHMLPLVILVVLYAGGVAWKSAVWGIQKRKMIRRFSEIASNPILMGQALGALALLVVVGIIVARSGNDAGMGVSPLELQFRSLLDKLLFVRPRTKEFLIGYPSLVAAIAFALRGRREWAAPLAVIGSIGLVSAINTFCHLHTPLVLSAMRVVIGAVVGLLLGGLLYAGLRIAARKTT